MTEIKSLLAAFKEQAQQTLNILQREKDLSPQNPLINASLTAFVSAVLNLSEGSNQRR